MWAGTSLCQAAGRPHPAGVAGDRACVGVAGPWQTGGRDPSAACSSLPTCSLGGGAHRRTHHILPL